MSIQPSSRHTYNPAQRTFFRTIKLRKQEKHPVFDAVQTLVKRTGADLDKLTESANVNKRLYKNWFDGDTLQPQFGTLSRTLSALGYQFQIVPIRTPVNGKAIKPAAPEIVWRKNHLS